MKLLVKRDPELGYAYFCPACKRFCNTAESCLFCGQALDWDAEKVPYTGRVKWPSVEECLNQLITDTVFALAQAGLVEEVIEHTARPEESIT